MGQRARFFKPKKGSKRRACADPIQGSVQKVLFRISWIPYLWQGSFEEYMAGMSATFALAESLGRTILVYRFACKRATIFNEKFSKLSENFHLPTIFSSPFNLSTFCRGFLESINTTWNSKQPYLTKLHLLVLVSSGIGVGGILTGASTTSDVFGTFGGPTTTATTWTHLALQWPAIKEQDANTGLAWSQKCFGFKTLDSWIIIIIIIIVHSLLILQILSMPFLENQKHIQNIQTSSTHIQTIPFTPGLKCISSLAFWTNSSMALCTSYMLTASNWRVLRNIS